MLTNIKGKIYFLNKFTTKIYFQMFYKEGQLKAFSNFINQHQQKGHNIQVIKYKDLIRNYNPFLIRQSYILQQFSKIFKNNLPYIQKHIHEFGREIPNLLLMYQTLNIHRKGIFQLLSKKQVRKQLQQLKGNLKQLSYMYKVIVQLHSTDNKQLLSFIKSLIFDSIKNKKSDLKQNEGYLLFNSSCSILKYNLMEKQFNKTQYQFILDFIENKIIPIIQHKTYFMQESYSLFSSLYQIMQIRNLKTKNHFLLSCFTQAQKIKSKNRYKRHKSIFFDKKKQEQDSQNDEKESKNRKNVFSQGESVFQIIFSKFLYQYGYNFQQNVIIGSNQYDIIVKGKRQKKYFPFQNLLDEKFQLKKDFKPITNQEWTIFKNNGDVSRIKINQPLQQIVLSLNGPSHYIDSDTYGINEVTRSQQIKRYYVKCKGYKRYGTVNFRQWQKIHEQGVHIREFIQKLLQQSLINDQI